MFEITIDSERMTVAFDGALDTSNSASTQEQLLATIAANNVNAVILDLGKLNYVSSAGLRVLFKIKQKVANTAVINASLAVYEVFSISGLTQLMDVNKSKREMNVDGCETIGTDNSGTRYRVDENTFIEVFSPDVEIEDVEEEIMLIQSAFAFGAGNSISFDIGKCGDSLATRFEYLPRESFAEALENNPDCFANYMDCYVEAFNRFGQAEYPEDGFDTIQDILHKRVDTLEAHIEPVEATALHELVDYLKDGYDLVHGDLNPTKFSMIDDELVLSYKSELAIGPAIYDVYCLQRFFTYAQDIPKDHIMRTTVLTPELTTQVKDAFYTRYFEGDDEASIEEKVAKIDLASTLEKYLYLATKDDDRIEELAQIYNDIYLRSILLPRKEEIAGLLATL